MKKIRLRNGTYTKVDDENYEYLSQFTWRQHKKDTCPTRSESIGKGKHKYILMSREILNAPNKFQVDHINGDNLNNCKENLRLVTCQQNAWNQKSNGGRSRYKGVCWCRQYKKWVATIWINKRSLVIGHSDAQNEAALLYDVAAQLFFGEYSRLNRPKFR